MLFSGNLLEHPCFDEIRGTDKYRIAGALHNSNLVMTNTFWVGVYPGMSTAMIDYMIEVIVEAFDCRFESIEE